MAVQLTVPEDALEALRPAFIAVEGDCEQWDDDEIVRRMLVRGLMDYAKSAGREWRDVAALAGQVRRALEGA